MVCAFCEAMGSYSPQTPSVLYETDYTPKGVVIFIKFDKSRYNNNVEKRRRKMKQGTLIYDESIGRYDIRFGLEDYYGGLHCGECFDVLIGGNWKPTRIEMGDDWYLVGVAATSLSGLIVRMTE